VLLGRTAEESSALRGTSDPAGQSRTEVWRKVRDPRNGSGRSQRFERFVRRKSCGSGGSRRSTAKSHGRPVGKPLRHPILGERPRERLAGNRLCEQSRKAKLVLSGPRRAQAGSNLPNSIGPRPEVGKRKTCEKVLRHWIARKSNLTRPTR